jgi:hypothetical protein
MEAKSGNRFAIACALLCGCANVCEAVSGATAGPAQVDRSGHATIALHAPPPDPAHPTHVLAYLWSSTAGKIDNPQSQSATLTCDKPGPLEVNLRITDGICDRAKLFALSCPGGRDGGDEDGGQ